MKNLVFASAHKQYGSAARLDAEVSVQVDGLEPVSGELCFVDATLAQL